MKKNKDFVVVANWKMNKTPAETRGYMREFENTVAAENFKILEKKRVVFCVPFTSISVAVDSMKNFFFGRHKVYIGAQNCHFENIGAFTGEVSADMLKDSGVDYVIIGHSERRIFFGETDDVIRKKVRACLGSGLRVILCVGENSLEREEGMTRNVIKRQVSSAVLCFDKMDADKILVAYEPVWAVGARSSASLSEIDEVSAFIRSVILDTRGPEFSNKISLIYGGSVSNENINEIVKLKSIDGCLLGRASLNCSDFVSILSKI